MFDHNLNEPITVEKDNNSDVMSQYNDFMKHRDIPFETNNIDKSLNTSAAALSLDGKYDILFIIYGINWILLYTSAGSATTINESAFPPLINT